MFTKKIISLFIVSSIFTLLATAPAVAADNASATPDTPIVVPQCWFICPPDQEAGDE